MFQGQIEQLCGATWIDVQSMECIFLTLLLL